MKMKKTLLPWSRRLMMYAHKHSFEMGHWAWYGCYTGFKGWLEDDNRDNIEGIMTEYRDETWR